MSNQTLPKQTVLAMVTFLLGLTTVPLTSRNVAAQPLRLSPADHDQRTTSAPAPAIEPFLDLIGEPRDALRALQVIEKKPHPGNAAMMLEVLPYVRSAQVRERVERILSQNTGVHRSRDTDDFYQALWRGKYTPNPRYAEFKATLYRQIDPRFAEYFHNDRKSTIRLDEVRWGGVVRDGIPPLNHPKTVTAEEATFLNETDVVFGVVVNGEARAYPKRILAWHEMVKDTVGETAINGVYCTLCGSMIVYFPKDSAGVHHELGTSGFLYRSNKLMYDHATKSMWSTIEGTPVIGPLVGKGIQLPVHHVVTTDWQSWQKTHPDTRVLSLETGHRRDYGEGVAYRKYFSTDQLMFTVPTRDRRLRNKAEVFIVRHQQNQTPLAISADFLQQNPVYQDNLGGLAFVVATDSSGANRAYESKAYRFQAGKSHNKLVDASNRVWTVTEEALVASDDSETLMRLPSHRAFWFGWHAVHPTTRLVQ
jgi:hypothetical protein